MNTKEQIKSCLTLFQAVADVIREAGPDGVPSGHLYALVIMPLGGGLDTHEKIISLLKHCELVKESNHLLTWIGPKSDEPTDDDIDYAYRKHYGF